LRTLFRQSGDGAAAWQSIVKSATVIAARMNWLKPATVNGLPNSMLRMVTRSRDAAARLSRKAFAQGGMQRDGEFLLRFLQGNADDFASNVRPG
jgi:hypothetical protein